MARGHPQVTSQLLNVAFFREQQNDTSGAIPFWRESPAIAEAVDPQTHPNLIAAQRLLAVHLCPTGAAAEGDSLIRTAIARVPVDSTHSTPNRLQSALGYCLTRQRRFAEAEPLLLQAEAGLRALLPGSARHRSLAVIWLVSRYEGWGKTEEARVAGRTGGQH